MDVFLSFTLKIVLPDPALTYKLVERKEPIGPVSLKTEYDLMYIEWNMKSLAR